jgi:8-oxo-dGTP diphosphatase
MFLMKVRRQKSAHIPIVAAGGIVVMTGRLPLIAIVQRRKDNGWVLPRGRIKRRESALVVARREVEEEIGHSVVVKKFLGSISYESNGRPKIVHFWLMASVGNDQKKLTGDTEAVKWLPLDAAVARLTQPVEQAFLGHIGERSLKKAHIVSRRRRSRTDNGHRASKLRGKAGTVPRKKQPFQAKTAQSSVTPKFIRRLFRRLHNPKHSSNQTTGRLN